MGQLKRLPDPRRGSCNSFISNNQVSHHGELYHLGLPNSGSEFMSDVKIGMLQRASLEAACFEIELNHRQTEKCMAQLDISELNALALRSLVTLFDEKAGLFSRSMTLDENGVFRRQKTSEKRTIIALLGLHRLKASGETLPFDVSSMSDIVLRDTAWVRSLGDLGLLTWFVAECEPDRLRNLFSKFDFENAFRTYSDARKGCTKALAWFLAGLSHARMVCPRLFPDLTDIAVDAYRLLEDNQSENGLFGHAAGSGWAQHLICSRFGTFGDQIHPIYALAVFARAFQAEEPIASALSCGNAVRAFQGELGQWWFLYDKRTSRAVSQYPVISMHQTGTAPLGLLALEEATGQNFHGPVHKGLSWVAGRNELGLDMRDVDRAVIWDSIESKKPILSYLDAAIGFIGISRGTSQESLGIRRAARPDHFGWLLYAFGSQGLPNVAVTPKLVGNRAGSTSEKPFAKLW